MSAEHRLSPAQRMGIVLAVVVALLGAIAGVVSASFWVMPGDQAAAEQARPTIQYTRLEFARAIERAIVGK